MTVLLSQHFTLNIILTCKRERIRFFYFSRFCLDLTISGTAVCIMVTTLYLQNPEIAGSVKWCYPFVLLSTQQGTLIGRSQVHGWSVVTTVASSMSGQHEGVGQYTHTPAGVWTKWWLCRVAHFHFHIYDPAGCFIEWNTYERKRPD